MINNKKFAIGIDLGTSRTVGAIYWSDQTIEVIKPENDLYYISSVVASKNKTMLVGSAAERQALSNSPNTIHSVKKRMGKNGCKIITKST